MGCAKKMANGKWTASSKLFEQAWQQWHDGRAI
jgi:hypothetical protein